MNFKNQGPSSELEMTFFSPVGTRAAKLKITASQAIWMEASRQTPLKKHPLFADLIRDRWWEKFGFIFGILPAGSEAKIRTDDHLKSRTLQIGKNEVECEYLTPTRVKRCRIEFSDLTGLLELNQYKCEG